MIGLNCINKFTIKLLKIQINITQFNYPSKIKFDYRLFKHALRLTDFGGVKLWRIYKQGNEQFFYGKRDKRFYFILSFSSTLYRIDNFLASNYLGQNF